MLTNRLPSHRRHRHEGSFRIVLPLLKANSCPSLAQHCWNLTRNIFRFVPCSLSLALNLHTVDERCAFLFSASTLLRYR